jgi:hypothetical protein
VNPAVSFALMTGAQAVFVVALSVVAVVIVVFATYVASTTVWSDRWYGRSGGRHRPDDDRDRGS